MVLPASCCGVVESRGSRLTPVGIDLLPHFDGGRAAVLEFDQERCWKEIGSQGKTALLPRVCPFQVSERT
eukprot:3870332-Rhodomonas_salina.1